MPGIPAWHVTKRFDEFFAMDDLTPEIDDRAFITLLEPYGQRSRAGAAIFYKWRSCNKQGIRADVMRGAD